MKTTSKQLLPFKQTRRLAAKSQVALAVDDAVRPLLSPPEWSSHKLGAPHDVYGYPSLPTSYKCWPPGESSVVKSGWVQNVALHKEGIACYIIDTSGVYDPAQSGAGIEVIAPTTHATRSLYDAPYVIPAIELSSFDLTHQLLEVKRHLTGVVALQEGCATFAAGIKKLEDRPAALSAVESARFQASGSLTSARAGECLSYDEELLSTESVFSVGQVLVSRITRCGDDGERVELAIPASMQQDLRKETSKQLRSLLSTPISTDQRERAKNLAKKARSAQSSPVTAKFRRMVHATF
ncbi:hypothetical protein SAMN03097694_2684 [Janthinobacterium lividum]|uniref:Uncharacterized protein n=1 Tax=Janthinobacterium lividum TaxID=29581 RepID=A0AB38C882_9BURK|nr:hypothetical protein [Janthinobacterium lividum]SFX63539.1 hypothetical protein SAMN03097694_2684 [Janthinobacterium lividum]